MKLFLSLILTSLCLQGLATHIVGGDIRYEQTGNETYVVTLTVYRDCGPDNVNETGFDDFPSVGIYENGVLIQNLLLSLFDAEVSNLTSDLDNPCLTLPPEVCVERAVYSDTVTLPTSNIGYDLVYQRCCRNPSIINILLPDDSGATFWTQIPPVSTAAQNSSPIFNNLPPIGLCANSAFVFDHSATDLDGDQLVYSFCDPLLGADPFQPAPSPPPPPPFLSVAWSAGFSSDYQITSNPAFQIDPTTGLITGTPTQIGQFVFGVCVEEYRDGVLLSKTNRDFQFNVVLCAGTQSPNFGVEDLCVGTTLQFENYSAQEENWLWDFGVDSGTSDTSTEFEPSFDFPDYGEYVVTLVSNPGETCSDSVQQVISVIPEDPLELQYSYAVPGPCSESTEIGLSFTGEGADVVVWEFGDGSMDEGFQLSHQYDDFGEYSITVLAYNEVCDYEESSSVTILFENYLLAGDVVLPNVFTPNNDGKNDLYLPYFEDDMGDRIVLPDGRSILDYLDLWEIRIYNRWGALVFENSAIQPAWDGRIEGDVASDGAYYCVLSYQKRCGDGPVETVEHDFSLMK